MYGIHCAQQCAAFSTRGSLLLRPADPAQAMFSMSDIYFLLMLASSHFTACLSLSSVASIRLLALIPDCEKLISNHFCSKAKYNSTVNDLYLNNYLDFSMYSQQQGRGHVANSWGLAHLI